MIVSKSAQKNLFSRLFDRYNITNDADLIAAAKKQEAYLDAQRGHNLGTICQIDEKRANSNELTP